MTIFIGLTAWTLLSIPLLFMASKAFAFVLRD